MNCKKREFPLFSACGLNCGLCPNHHTNGASRCSGCGGEGFFYPSCPIFPCNERHGGIEYCYLCDEYPCKRYDNAEDFDSFVTHRNQLKDNEKAKRIGMDAYAAQLHQKIELLQFLLTHYNDGRRKGFFCIAVNLLELSDLEHVLQQMKRETVADFTIKEKAALAVRLLQAMADEREITLKLRKKPKS